MKNILITGVSRGLGLELATVALESGNTVFGVCRTVSDGLKKLSEKFLATFKLLQYDLSDADNIYDKIFNDFIGVNIPLHAFINNAAAVYDDIATNIVGEPLSYMFNVNVFAPIITTKYAIRNFLLHSTKGSIVNISSICAHTGYKGLSVYAATKGAIEAFSKNTAREWGEKGIRSNCVVAGFMETAMSAPLTDEQKQRIYRRTSLKTPTDIKSVAATAMFLVSDESASITGQNIFVDSGTI